MKDDVGIKIATHGWIGSEITGGKFMLEDGAEMQWKEEREVISAIIVYTVTFVKNELQLFSTLFSPLFLK